jgi:predicted nicotinamide N-methyase
MPALQLQTYRYQSFYIEYYAPDPIEVQIAYETHKEKDPQAPFPFWTKVWPSAQALAQFLIDHPEYIAGKKVMELAAGLALPALVAARFASHVECSDYLPEAVAVIKGSVAHNRLQNVDCMVRNWASMPEGIHTDILLLSDVNYAPDQFEILYKLIEQFLTAGVVILLATPHRLTARPFLDYILPWVMMREEIIIQEEQGQTMSSIFLLQK